MLVMARLAWASPNMMQGSCQGVRPDSQVDSTGFHQAPVALHAASARSAGPKKEGPARGDEQGLRVIRRGGDLWESGQGGGGRPRSLECQYLPVAAGAQTLARNGCHASCANLERFARAGCAVRKKGPIRRWGLCGWA